MGMLIGKIVFWCIFAVVFACIEIESEGEYGWAHKAPTWYRTQGFVAKLYGLAMGGKPLTGYHTFMFFVPLLIFHASFFSGAPWSVSAEFGAIALYFAWCPLWDYYWFVLNPAYHKKFKKGYVWWHAKSFWVFGLFPVDYLIGAIVSFGLQGIACAVDQSTTPIIEHAKLVGGFAAFTVLLHLLAPLYRSWYAKMRKKDDRDKVDIFYK